MAWNGSKTEDASKNPASAPKRNAAKSPSLSRGLIAGGFVVFIGILALYFITGEKDDPATAPQKPSVIAEVDPDLAPEADAKAEEAAAPAKPKPLGPQKVGETRDGKILLPSGRLHTVKGVITNNTASTMKAKYEIFDHSCENEIACMLTLEPGEGLIGTPRYNGRFKKDFIESLRSPIIVGDNDSEEDKALKRNVIAAKIEMKEALDRGEDIEQIMLDTRAEYQKLAFYKMELKQQLDAMRAENKDMSAQDLEDMVGAANKMLEEKGIAPLKYGPLIKQKMLMMIEQENSEGK